MNELRGIEVKAQGETAEVLVYDQIGADWLSDGITSKAFAEALKSAGPVKQINVRINSPGGSVWEGTAIYNTLVNHPAKVTVLIDGAALSAASLVAMAGDEIRMAANGFLMIHDPMNSVRGGRAEDLRKAAEMLDKVKAVMVETYAKRTRQPAAEIARMMSEETWLDAKDAVRLGFADAIADKADSTMIAASFDAGQFKNVPDRFLELVNTPRRKGPTMPEANTAAGNVPQAASIDELQAHCTGADDTFIVAQLKAKATLPQAMQAWMAEQHRRLRAAEEQIEKQEEEEKAKAAAEEEEEKKKEEEETSARARKLPGVKPLAGGKGAAATAEDPQAEWREKVDAKVAGGMTRAKAVQAVNRAHPELRTAMLVAHNDERGRGKVAREMLGV